MFLPILFIVVAVLSIFFLNGKYNEYYWKKRRVVYDSTNKYIGPMIESLYSKLSLWEIISRTCETYPDAPAVGMASFVKPTLLVKDITNIQQVLSTDFNSFSHRSVEANEGDLLADNIVFTNGKKWKVMRQQMTPLFTATKLKSMYYIMDKSAQDFVRYLKKNPQYLRGNAFETLCTFCNAAIGASVFGVQTESVFDSPFLKMAREFSSTSSVIIISFILTGLSPKLSKWIGLKMFKKFEKFFIGAIKQIIREREESKIKQHDFADICVSIQSHGTFKDPDTGLEIEPTDEYLAAQAFFFFVAGVEPSATCMLSTLVELGNNPEALMKVHEEIDRAFHKHSTISYDVLYTMEYLDMVIKEAMRLHPPINSLNRKCIQDTVLPVGNIKVEKDTRILIPIYQVHHDEKFYTDPKAFKPERFSKDNKHTNDAAYMPFGKGGRICIGTRYAALQVKAGLVHLLRNYTVKVTLQGNKITYKRDIVQMRINNADVKFIPRKIINVNQ